MYRPLAAFPRTIWTSTSTIYVKKAHPSCQEAPRQFQQSPVQDYTFQPIQTHHQIHPVAIPQRQVHQLWWWPHNPPHHILQPLCIGTGWPKSKFPNSNGYNSENTHFWPHLGTAKMCFGGLHLFSFFSCLFTIFSCLFTIFKNKWRPPKHILALPTWGQKCIFLEL